MNAPSAYDNYIKTCVAVPTCLHHICFRRPAQARTLCARYRGYSQFQCWATLNLYKCQCVFAARDYINFGAARMSACDMTRVNNVPTMHAQKHA